MGAGVGFKGIIIIAIGLDQGMGMGAGDRNTKYLSSSDVGSSIGSAYDGCPCSPDGGVHLLGPAAAKLQEGLIFDNCPNPRSLGRNQGLEIDDIEQGGFHQLALGQRAFNLDDGFVGKDQITFAGGFDGQLQFQITQIGQESFIVAQVA